MTPPPALLSSGIPAVDARWGGYASGAAYAIVGRADAGRLELALHAVRAAVEAGARCLLVSPRDTASLAETASHLHMDLGGAHADGRLRVLRMPAADALAGHGDAGLTTAYADLGRLVATDRPDRVIVEDLTPLLQFETLDAFDAAFRALVESVTGTGATLLVGLGEPANEVSARLVEIVRQRMAGVLQIEGDGTSRRLSLAGPRPAAASTPPPRTAHPVSPVTPAAPPVMSGGAAAPSAAPPAEGDAPSTSAPSALAAVPSPAAALVSAAPAPVPPALVDPPVHSGDGVPSTALSAPPPADPELLVETSDPFNQDASTFISQGFLVDSAAGAVVGHVPMSPPLPAPSPTVAQPDADRPAFVSSLNSAFATGEPFDVVALRMDPHHPASAHFDTVVGGLRASMGPADGLYVDTERQRAIVLLPGTDRSGELFAGLQAHVRTLLGSEATAVLGAVSAAPIPGGAPFTSGHALMTYAIDQ